VVRLGFGPDEIRFPWPFLSHEGGPAESPGQRGSVFHVRNHERKSQGTKKTESAWLLRQESLYGDGCWLWGACPFLTTLLAVYPVVAT